MNEELRFPEADGSTSRRGGNWGPLAMALLIAIGIIIAVAFVTAWGSLLVTQLSRRATDVTYEYLQFQLNGEPLITQRLANGKWQYVTLNGKILDQSRRAIHMARQIYLNGPRARWNRESQLPAVGFAGAEFDPSSYWYWMKNTDRSGEAYLEGFQPESKQRIGFIGKDGFQANQPVLQQQFDISNSSNSLTGYSINAASGWEPYVQNGKSVPPILVAAGRALTVNLRTYTLKQVGDVSGVVSADRLHQTKLHLEDGQDSAVQVLTGKIALRTKDRIVSVDEATGEEQAWKLPEHVARDAVSFLFLDNDILQAEVLEPVGFHDQFQRAMVYWLKPSGEIQREVEVSLLSNQQSALFAQIFRLNGAPLMGIVAEFVAIPLSMVSAHHTSYFAELQDSFRIDWPWFMLLVLYGVVAIVLARRHARAHRLKLHPLWWVFLAVLGIPGYLGYRWHRHWPPRTLHAPPVLNGTEILVPA